MHPPLPLPLPQCPTWPEQRVAFHLLDAKGVGADARLVTAAHGLLPEGQPSPPQGWCAATLREGGAHRCCLTPHCGLTCAVELVVLPEETGGNAILIRVMDAADALSDPRWRAAAAFRAMLATAGMLTHKTNRSAWLPRSSRR